MPNVNDLGESKYLKKEDVDPDVLVEIESYERVNLAKDNQKAEMKFILHVRGINKKLPLNKEGEEKAIVLNKTNGNRIAFIAGTGDFDGWIGKQVVLWSDPMVEFGGNLVGGLRIRAPKKQPTGNSDDLLETKHSDDEVAAAQTQADDIPF